jgi:hypothetical protein
MIIIKYLKKLDYQRAWYSSPALCLIIKGCDNQAQELNNQFVNVNTQKNLVLFSCYEIDGRGTRALVHLANVTRRTRPSDQDELRHSVAKTIDDLRLMLPRCDILRRIKDLHLYQFHVVSLPEVVGSRGTMPWWRRTRPVELMCEKDDACVGLHFVCKFNCSQVRQIARPVVASVSSHRTVGVVLELQPGRTNPMFH